MPIDLNNSFLAYPTPSGLGTGPISIECWFYVDSIIQSYLCNVNTAGGTSFYTVLQLNASNQLSFFAQGNFTNYARVANTILKTGLWYHGIATCPNNGNSSEIHIYINGQEDSYGSTGLEGQTVATNTGPVIIGGRQSDTARRPDGRIHRMRIYNTVIPSGAIASGYADPSGYNLETIYSSNLVFNAPYDTHMNSTPGVGSSGVAVTGTASGTVTLTSGYPLGIPGLAFHGNFSSPNNTITSTRISTLADLSNNNCNLVEVSSNGPIVVSNPSGIGVGYGAFLDTSNRRLHNPTGLYMSSQRGSIITWFSAEKCGVTSNQPLMELGATATTGTDEISLYINSTSQLSIDRRGLTVSTGYYLVSCTPRMIGATFNSSGTLLYMDKISSVGPALTLGTSTGIIIGAECGPTGNNLNGNMFATLVYQRTLSSGELNGLWAYGSNLYGYTLPTHMLSCEGSSTMDGYQSLNNQNAIQRLGLSVSGILVYNFANTSENRGHFNAQYAAQLGAAATLNGFPKAKRLCFLQPFGNDWDNRVTSLATIENDYQTFINSVNNDYATLFFLAPQPRADYSTGDMDQNREIDALDFITWFSSRATIVPRFAQIQPASTASGDIEAVTQGPYYFGDQVHFSASGYQAMANAFNTVLSNYFNPSTTASLVASVYLSSLRRLNSLHVLGNF